MDYKVYWVGERPGGAMQVTVLDQETGEPYDLSLYREAKLHMLDSKNREVDLGNGETVITNASAGRVAFIWPTDKTIFDTPGEYVFQLELTSGTVSAKTTVEQFLVRKLGGRK